MLPSYIKLPCVEIVNDKLTNISQKESASNPVSFVAIKQQQQKKKTNRKATTTTMVKTIALKQMRLWMRQGLYNFSLPFLSIFVVGVVILQVFLILFDTSNITAASFYTIDCNKHFYAIVNL